MSSKSQNIQENQVSHYEGALSCNLLNEVTIKYSFNATPPSFHANQIAVTVSTEPGSPKTATLDPKNLVAKFEFGIPGSIMTEVTLTVDFNRNLISYEITQTQAVTPPQPYGMLKGTLFTWEEQRR